MSTSRSGTRGTRSGRGGMNGQGDMSGQGDPNGSMGQGAMSGDMANGAGMGGAGMAGGDYPRCSATVTDHCMQGGGRGTGMSKRRMRHRAMR